MGIKRFIERRVKAAQSDRLFKLAGEGTSLQAREGGENEKPKVSGVAYNGGKMTIRGWPFPVVVDLAGMDVPTGKIHLDCDHSYDVRDRLGSVTAKIGDNKLEYEGRLIAENDAAQNIITHAKAGESWDVSIDARALDEKLIPTGETDTVNGQSFDGPVIVITQSRLQKISVVTQGADGESNMNVAARKQNTGEHTMNREIIIKALLATENFGEDDRVMLEAKSDEQLKALHAKLVEAKEGGQPDTQAGGQSGGEPMQFDPEALKTKVRNTVQAEEKRLDGIRSKCRDYEDHLEAGKLSEIREQAVQGKISEDKLELELIKASRPVAGSHIQTGGNGGAPAAKAIEAALCRTLDVQDVEKQYDEKTMEAADKMSRQGYGIKAMLQDAASLNGLNERRVNDGNLRQVLQAAFSTQAVSDLLDNVANKVLRDAFLHVEQNWRQVARIRSVPDFKEVEHHRLTGKMEYEKVAPDGELKHGELSEDKYTSQADTYGKMFTLNRKDIINDDLGAFDDLRAMLGRGAALKLNTEFWDKINNLADSWFDRGKITTAPMSFDGLEKVYQEWSEMTDDSDHPLGLEPEILLTGTDLRIDAQRLMQQAPLITGESETMASRHPMQGMFRVVWSHYLTRASNELWYMVANPQALPFIIVSFLNGRQEPYVESTQADFNTLGIKMRGYYDFGVSEADSQAAIRAEDT